MFVTFRFLPIAASIALIAAPALAQQDDGQIWLQINTNIPIADHFKLTLEQIGRFSDRQDGLYTTEFGGLLSYSVAKNVELGFGYRRASGYNLNVVPGENRLRQQVVATFGHLSTRLRIDERFSDAGPGIGFRIRPLLRYNIPLDSHGLKLFVAHESFFLPNSTGWGQRSGYERMRNMVGLNFPIGHYIVADTGYLNQYRFSRDGKPARMDHALNLQLTINLASHPSPAAHD